MNLFAYTAPGASYPGYVSVNRTEGGDISVTVRSPPKDGSEGVTATYVVPAAEWPTDWTVK